MHDDSEYIHGLHLEIYFWMLAFFLSFLNSSSKIPIHFFMEKKVWAVYSSSKCLLCSTQERKSYKFGMTWVWVNDDRMKNVLYCVLWGILWILKIYKNAESSTDPWPGLSRWSGWPFVVTSCIFPLVLCVGWCRVICGGLFIQQLRGDGNPSCFQVLIGRPLSHQEDQRVPTLADEVHNLLMCAHFHIHPIHLHNNVIILQSGSVCCSIFHHLRENTLTGYCTPKWKWVIQPYVLKDGYYYVRSFTYTEQIYKRNTFVFAPIFHELNSKI